MVAKVYMASYYEPYESDNFIGLFHKLEDAKAACQERYPNRIPLEWVDSKNESAAAYGGGEYCVELTEII